MSRSSTSPDSNQPARSAVKSLPSWATLDLKKLSQRQKAAVITFIGIVICLVGIRLWADSQMRNLPSPNFVTATADRIAISWGNEVLIYDYAGNRIDNFPIPQGSELTHLAYDPDGNLWLGDYQTKQILRWENGQWKAVVNGSGTIKGTFKFVFFQQTGEIFVTDTGNHRILVFAANGKLSRMFGKEGKGLGELKFPNEIVIFDDNLLVVNTNAGRVDLFSREGSFLKTVAKVEELTPTGYKFPTMLTLLNGEVALLLTDDLFKARAVIYDFNGKHTGNFYPPHPLEEAGDISSVRDRVIITDRAVRRVYSFDVASSKYLGPLNADLDARSNSVNQQATLYSGISSVALWLLLIICLAVAVLFAGFRRQQVRASLIAASCSADENPDIIWGVSTDRRQYLRMALICCLLIPLTLLIVPFLLGESIKVFLHPMMTVIIILWIALFRSLMASNLANVAKIEHVQKLLHIAWQSMTARLASGETIKGCTAVMRSHLRKKSSLLALTDRRLLVADFKRDLFQEALEGISSLPYEQITDLRLTPSRLSFGWLSRLVKAEKFVFTIVHMQPGHRQSLTFYSWNREILGRFKGLIEDQQTISAGMSGDITDKSVPVIPTRQRERFWTAAALSALFPGLGQFYNRQIVKGGILAALFSAQIVLLTRPFIQLIEGSAETRPRDVPLLVTAFAAVGITWILGIADAWRTARRRVG